MFLLHSALHCLQSCADGQSLRTVRKQSSQADYSMPPLLLVSQARFLVVSGLQVFFCFFLVVIVVDITLHCLPTDGNQDWTSVAGCVMSS